MSDVDDDLDNDVMFALTANTPDGPVYWSLQKGWTQDPDKAWLLYRSEVDGIEDDEKMMAKLPQHKERMDSAQWEPVYRRMPYAEGVSDDP